MQNPQDSFIADLRVIEQSIMRDEAPVMSLNHARDFCKEAIEAAKIKREKPELEKTSPPQSADNQHNDPDYLTVLRANHFVRKSLPIIVKSLLRRKPTPQFKDVAVDFLKDVLVLIIEWMDFDDLSLLKVMIDIFDDDGKFYLSRSPEYTDYRYHQSYPAAVGHDSSDSDSESSGDFACAPTTKHDSFSSSILIELMNIFGELDGYSKILERISNHENKLSVTSLLYYLKAVDNVFKLFKESFIEQWAIQLKDYVFELMLSLNQEELKATNKVSITSATDFIEAILSYIMRPEEVGKIVEPFQLKIALKCLHSLSLEKRLQGLNGINKLIMMTTKKDSFQRVQYPVGGFNNPQRLVRSTKWLTSEQLLEWIQKNNIIDELFGSKMHHELLKRANEIFKLLAQKKVFTLSHIDLLWNSCLGKQEAAVAAIFSLFKDLLPYFEKEYFDHLLKRFNEFPIKDYDINFITLLNDIAENCVAKRITQYDGYPVEILWKVIQDDSGVSDEIFTSTLNNLLQLFLPNREVDKSIINRFTENCVGNLQEHKSVPQSLEILQKIFAHHPKRVVKMTHIDNRDTLIEEVIKKYGLVDLLFKDLQHYHKIAAEKASSVVDKSQINQIRLINGYYPHLQHLHIRLSFMRYIMKNATIPLEKDHLSTLWSCMIENALTNEEQDLCFTCIGSLCDQSTESELLMYLFEEKLKQLDFESVHEAGFKCFETFFNFINLEKGKLSHNRAIVDMDLFGLDCFWEIAMAARDETVASEAISFLVGLFDNLAPVLSPRQDELREDYMRKIMEKMKDANLRTSSGIFPAQLRIERCLELLTRFVNDYDMQQIMKLSKTNHSPNDQLVQVPIVLVPAGDKFNTTSYVNSSVMELCSRLAKYITSNSRNRNLAITSTELKPTNIQLTINNQIMHIQDFPKTLQEVGVTDQSVVTVAVVDSIPSYPKGTASLLANDTKSPRYFLSHSPKSFEQLFDLLDFNEIIGEKVWELVSELPTNPNLFSKISNINETTDWKQLFQSHSTLQLLYYLEIIETIATSTESESLEAIESGQDWFDKFIVTGGIQSVYSIFLEYEDLLQGRLKSKCLDTLLKVINIFMLSRNAQGYSLGDITSWDWINYQVLVGQLVKIIWTSAKNTKDSPSFIDGELVKHSGSLLIACMISKPELLDVLFQTPKFSDFLRCVLLETAEESIRREMTGGIIHLCSQLYSLPELQNPEVKFIPMMVKFLGTIEPDSQFCTEYFSALVHLYSLSLTKNQAAPTYFNEAGVSNQLIGLIVNHPIVEKDEVSIKDLVLIGMMNLLQTILEARPDLKDGVSNTFVEHLFIKCLFEIPTSDVPGANAPPKCKTKESRKSTFDLLQTLSTNSFSHFHNQLSLINQVHVGKCKCTEWNYSPSSEQRSPVGYVGIKNLGCICYMNSLMQQLFLMPKFRQGILAIDDTAYENEDEPKEETLIYQIQAMFSYLQESQKEYYNPIEFCRANKDYDGQPTDVSLQMDVDEFFNMLCEKVENSLKKTKQEKLLKDIWCGNLCSQLICRECKFISERDEAFFTVSLDIKNRSNIIEALDFYVQGEMLTGDDAYFCEKCDKKVEALMRRCLKDLPSTLILHLKRFEFNLDTMRKVKLNDYCEFPNALSLKPYTKEGILQKEREDAIKEGKEVSEDTITPEHPDSYYEYQLVGILVHRGVADSGHYYSFIKLRGVVDSQPQWIEFNDEVVKPFDVTSIENECFGGKEDFSTSQDLNRFKKVIARTRNAYMLIYERVDLSIGEPPQELPGFTITKKAQENFSVAVPSQLYDQVWEENVKFLMDKKVFDVDYFEFCCNLIENHLQTTEQQVSPSESPSTVVPLDVVSGIFLNILTHSREGNIILKFEKHLEVMLQNNIDYCKHLLQVFCETKILKQYLLECTLKETRYAVARLLYTLVMIILPAETELIEKYLNFTTRENSVILSFIAQMNSISRYLPWHWRTFSQYFYVFKMLAKETILCELIIQTNLPNTIFSLIVQGHTGRDSQKIPKMGDKIESPNFEHAIDLLSIMVRSSTVRNADEEEEEESEEEDNMIDENPYYIRKESNRKIYVSSGTFEKFQSELFLKKVVTDKNLSKPLGTLLCFWIYDNPSFSDRVISLLRTAINDAEFDQLAPPFKVLAPVLNVQDHRQQSRVSYIMESLFQIFEKFKKYPKFSKNLITNIVELEESCNLCKLWLKTNPTQQNKIDAWLASHGYGTQTANRGWTQSSNYQTRAATSTVSSQHRYP